MLPEPDEDEKTTFDQAAVENVPATTHEPSSSSTAPSTVDDPAVPSAAARACASPSTAVRLPLAIAPCVLTEPSPTAHCQTPKPLPAADALADAPGVGPETVEFE